jgi:hypothetical protein
MKMEDVSWSKRRWETRGWMCLESAWGVWGFGDAEHWIHKWALNSEGSRPIIQRPSSLGILEVVRLARASRSRFRSSANVATLQALLADVGEGEP